MTANTDCFPSQLDLIVFDFDGVMTDNTVITFQNGTEAVTSNRTDGLGIQLLLAAGFHAMVLSKQKNPVTKARCDTLGIECVHGIDDKAAYLTQYLAKRQINPAFVAYVGNDTNDIEVMGIVGLPVAVQDAHPAVLPHAKLILTQSGGKGAVREFCDAVMARY